MGNEGPPALNTKINRRNGREIMSLMSRSRDEDTVPQNQAQLNQNEPDEPLAQLGVAPGGEASANNSSEE